MNREGESVRSAVVTAFLARLNDNHVLGMRPTKKVAYDGRSELYTSLRFLKPKLP